MEYNRLTKLQQKLVANYLLLAKPSWEEDSLIDTINLSKIDLQPHQIAAALFPFENPYSKGAILADEVGLGKTIEAGLVISQFWSLRKRKVLIICPKALIAQWKAELKNLLYLESEILETKDWTKIKKGTRPNPFSKDEFIVITTEFWAAKNPEFVRSIRLNLTVIDEAHKFRNVYNPAPSAAKRSKSVRTALLGCEKIILLTATPIQNNLLDMFGLVSFIDDKLLGTFESFKANYRSYNYEGLEDRLENLKERLSLVQTRELRKNCVYIDYKDRHAIDEYFEASDEEQKLYEDIAGFINDTAHWTIPTMNRSLIELIYHRLLGSSIPAVKTSILKLARNIFITLAQVNNEPIFNEVMRFLQENTSRDDFLLINKHIFQKCITPDFNGLRMFLDSDDEKDSLDEDFDSFEEANEDLRNGEVAEDSNSNVVAAIDKEAIIEELKTLISLYDRCNQAQKHSKAEKLIFVLKEQLRLADERGFPKKAVIFTEFRKTQDFILNVLKEDGFDITPQAVMIRDHRTGNDRKVSGIFKEVAIYHGGSGGDIQRAEIIRQFKENDDIKILVSTESGAEGLNLQFCNLIINYDLPWNPQRIEQRIGRCHRYGQKFEVFVVNFINKKNMAEVRVYEILKNKFKLFEGVFGASDNVISALTSNTNFELQILQLYKNAKDPEQLEREYQKIFSEQQETIDEKMKEAFDQLIYHFDKDVVQKVNLDKIKDNVESKLGLKANLIRDLILSYLGRIRFEMIEDKAVKILCDGFPQYPVSFERNQTYPFIPISDPDINDRIKSLASSEVDEIAYTYKLPDAVKMTVLEEFRGRSFLLEVYKLSVKGIETQDFLYYVLTGDDGTTFDDQEALHHLLTLESEPSNQSVLTSHPDNLSGLTSFNRFKEAIIEDFHDRNTDLWMYESERIDGFKDDLLKEIEIKLDQLGKKQTEHKKQRRDRSLSRDERLAINRQLSRLETEESNLADRRAEIIRECNDDKSKSRKTIEEKSKVSTSEEKLVRCPILFQ